MAAQQAQGFNSQIFSLIESMSISSAIPRIFLRSQTNPALTNPDA